MVIGSLLYLMLGTRPDIAFAVTHLSCHATNPSQDHLNKALYICRYLIGTSTHSLVYNGGSGAGLIACTDSDWGSDPTVTTMSNSGSYLDTPVTSQLYSSTPVTLTYSGHGRTVIPHYV